MRTAKLTRDNDPRPCRLCATIAERPGIARIGISGWRYAPWRGVFFPPGLPQHSELVFASHMFGSIEINGSFYSLQRPSSYRQWHDDVPADFIFAVKGPRYVTHMRRLREIRTPLANFFASGVLTLAAKLGPILWQFPPQLRFNAGLFAAFFSLLPKDTEEAARLAREHDHRLAGRAELRVQHAQHLRHAIEVRHPSFAGAEFVALAREYGLGIVVADTAGRWPLIEDLTADFVYIRLHGDEELYTSGYDDHTLQRWAQRIDTWRKGGQLDDAHRASPEDAPGRRGRDVYCYFDNDVKVHAPYDAARLSRLVGVHTALDEEHPGIPHVGGVQPRLRAPAFR